MLSATCRVTAAVAAAAAAVWLYLSLLLCKIHLVLQLWNCCAVTAASAVKLADFLCCKVGSTL